MDRIHIRSSFLMLALLIVSIFDASIAGGYDGGGGSGSFASSSSQASASSFASSGSGSYGNGGGSLGSLGKGQIGDNGDGAGDAGGKPSNNPFLPGGGKGRGISIGLHKEIGLSFGGKGGLGSGLLLGGLIGIDGNGPSKGCDQPGGCGNGNSYGGPSAELQPGKGNSGKGGYGPSGTGSYAGAGSVASASAFANSNAGAGSQVPNRDGAHGLRQPEQKLPDDNAHSGVGDYDNDKPNGKWCSSGQCERGHSLQGHGTENESSRPLGEDGKLGGSACSSGQCELGHGGKRHPVGSGGSPAGGKSGGHGNNIVTGSLPGSISPGNKKHNGESGDAGKFGAGPHPGHFAGKTPSNDGSATHVGAGSFTGAHAASSASSFANAGTGPSHLPNGGGPGFPNGGSGPNIGVNGNGPAAVYGPSWTQEKPKGISGFPPIVFPGLSLSKEISFGLNAPLTGIGGNNCGGACGGHGSSGRESPQRGSGSSGTLGGQAFSGSSSNAYSSASSSSFSGSGAYSGPGSGGGCSTGNCGGAHGGGSSGAYSGSHATASSSASANSGSFNRGY